MANVKKYKMKGGKMKGGGGGCYPADDYEMAIVKNEIKPSSNKDDMLCLELEILTGEYKGRKHFENLLLEHDNPQVVQIAADKIYTISLACGDEDEKNFDKLMNIPMLVSLYIKEPTKADKKRAKKAGREAKPQNQSSGFEPIGKSKNKNKDKDSSAPPWNDKKKKKGKKKKK